MSEQQRGNGRLTMDTLLMNTGLKHMNEQVDQEITEIDLPQIADLFDNIDDLCEQFGLSNADKTDVETERSLKGTRESAKKALKIWRKQNPFKPTFKSLLTILLDIKKGVVAKGVAEYISKRPQREATNKQPRPKKRYLISAVVVILAIGLALLVMPSPILKMMSVPQKENTIDTLMIHIGLTYKQVNQKIAEKDLSKIADLFDSIDDFCEQFGLLPAEKKRLRNVQSTEESVKKALKIWSNRYQHEATFKNLLTILLDNEKGGVAINVAHYIFNRHQQRPTNKQPKPKEGTKRKAYYRYFFELAVVILAICMGLVVRVLYNKHSMIPITRTMTNFKDYNGNKTVWYSPPAYTHYRGYKICLSVHANGWRRGKGRHVSVSVQLMRGEFDDSLKWPFRGTVHFKLIDQLHGEDHREFTLTYDDTIDNKMGARVTEGDRGCGKRQFIKQSELKPKYLSNNTLVFQIHKCSIE